MPKTISTTVYTIDELTDDVAKERAREWWRLLENQYFGDGVGALYDDFMECARLLGITIHLTPKGIPDIPWSGFGSQGDGASYAGHYAYAKGARKAIREHAPQDATLHGIADALTSYQVRHGYGVTASITRDGHAHYSHAGTMRIEVTDRRGNELDDADDLRNILRDFANWIYRQLETEHHSQMSDDTVDDNIRANDYTFTADGKRFG